MKHNIKITKTENSKLENLDFNNIPLGRTFTDHMFICDYENGAWTNPRIEPLHLIPTHPAAMALHYGQAIFEGMKSTLNVDGNPMLICPEKNAERLNFSARRIGMPELPIDLFVEGLKQLVSIDSDWIPPMTGSALYLRPFMYADEAFIGMRAATHYKKGYDQILWLDAHEFKYIQEVGTMNIFFKINGKFITPNLDGCILNGISRILTIELLRKRGYEVVERPISIDEVLEASNNGTLEEAFGTGTAVGVAMIEEIGYKDKTIHVSDDNPIGQMVLDTVNGIRSGRMEDEMGWMVTIKN
jgi:branched-chain amino acid aminotransferase